MLCHGRTRYKVVAIGGRAELVVQNICRANSVSMSLAIGGGFDVSTLERGRHVGPLFRCKIKQALLEGIGSNTIQRRRFQLQRQFRPTETQNNSRVSTSRKNRQTLTIAHRAFPSNFENPTSVWVSIRKPNALFQRCFDGSRARSWLAERQGFSSKFKKLFDFNVLSYLRVAVL